MPSQRALTLTVMVVSVLPSMAKVNGVMVFPLMERTEETAPLASCTVALNV